MINFIAIFYNSPLMQEAFVVFPFRIKLDLKNSPLKDILLSLQYPITLPRLAK